MPLPGNGTLSLQGHSRPGDTVHSKPKQAMIVRMSAETLEELESFPHQPPMEFEFGENPGIYIGENFFPMRPLKEDTPHELYLRASSAAKPMAPLKLYANVTGKFTVERELREKTQAQLRDRTREEEKLRRGHQTQWLETPPDLPATNGKKRKLPQASSMFRKPTDHLRPNNASTSSTTLLSRPASPLPPPPPTSTREGSAPIRKRLIQCLAVSDRMTDEVVKLVGGGEPDSSLRRDFMNLLDDVAEQAVVRKGGETPLRPWRLKTRTWLEVRPYEWPRLSETERTNMARNARMAFKHMNIPESDPAWTHVKYRAATTTVPATNLSQSSTSALGLAKTGTPKVEAPKRGVLSKDAKEKKAQAKADNARFKGEVLMKDESKVAQRVSSTSAGAKGREVVEEAEIKGVSASSTSGVKPPTRKGPGSGYKASKSSSKDSRGGSASTDGLNPITAIQKPVDVRTKDREPPAPSLPARSAPIPTPVPNQDKKRAVTSTSVSRMKKMKDPAVGGFDSDREADRDIGRERGTRGGDEEKMREKAMDKDPTFTGVKRKKPAREWDDEGVATSSVQKRPRTEDNTTTTQGRDLSLPKKPDTSAVPQRSKTKQESPPLPPQPMRTKLKKEREASPSPPLASSRPRARKEASPLPAVRSSAVSQPKVSSGSSQRHADYQVERSTKASGASKTRRRSPIYTSSEDEVDVPRRDTTSNPVPQSHASHARTHTHSHSHSHVRPRPSLPAPTDHAGLRARYSSSYLEYLKSLQQVLAQKRKIENLLRTGNGSGSIASITDSDGDVMDAEELARLSAEHRALTEELQGIQRVFMGSGKGGSLSD